MANTCVEQQPCFRMILSIVRRESTCVTVMIKYLVKIFPEWADCQAYSKEKRKLGKYSPESKSPHGGGWWMEPVTVWRGWSCKGKLKQATGIRCNSCTIYLGISHGPKSRQWATWSTLETECTTSWTIKLPIMRRDILLKIKHRHATWNLECCPFQITWKKDRIDFCVLFIDTSASNPR